MYHHLFVVILAALAITFILAYDTIAAKVMRRAMAQAKLDCHIWGGCDCSHSHTVDSTVEENSRGV